MVHGDAQERAFGVVYRNGAVSGDAVATPRQTPEVVAQRLLRVLADAHVLIVLHRDERELLDEPGVVFERHEVSGFSADVVEDGEGRRIALLLHLALGRLLGIGLGRAGLLIEPGVLSPGVHQHEADGSLVATHGRHARVPVGVAVRTVDEGSPLGGLDLVQVAGIPPTVDEFAPLVELGYDEGFGLDAVHPCGGIIDVVRTNLAGLRVQQDDAVGIASAEADAVLVAGHDVVGTPVLVDLEREVREADGRVPVLIQIPMWMVAEPAALVVPKLEGLAVDLAHHAHVALVGGGDHDVARRHFLVQPLPEAGVVQRHDPVELSAPHLDVGRAQLHRAAERRVLAKLLLTEAGGNPLVDDANLGGVNRRHVRGECALVDVDEVAVG